MGVISCGTTMLDQGQFQNLPVVNWDTTVKTANFTAVAGNGYFVNSTAAARTVTLPASPSAGNIVSVKDYAGTAQTNAITIARNGSNINGAAEDVIIINQGGSVTFFYIDATQGWVVINSGQTNDAEPAGFICATGGTITTSGDYKIHTFTSPGTFDVTQAGNAGGTNTFDYMVVAGGGGTGSKRNGGGGAGGFRESPGAASGCYPVSPLATGGCANVVTAVAGGATVTVGAGGGKDGSRTNGSDSSIGGSYGITSSGGGYGSHNDTSFLAQPGGSGGGGGKSDGNNTSPNTAAANGNDPPTNPPQGQPGGAANTGNPNGGGGGGGATDAGDANPNPGSGGVGGDGAQTSISGTATYYAGGGAGGSSFPGTAGNFGGLGGGGPAVPVPAPATNPDQNGLANSGGGGGSGRDGTNNTGGSGGSGIVIIRYKYQ